MFAGNYIYKLFNAQISTGLQRSQVVLNHQKGAPNDANCNLIFQKSSASEGGTSPLRHPPGAANRGAMAASQPYGSREIAPSLPGKKHFLQPCQQG